MKKLVATVLMASAALLVNAQPKLKTTAPAVKTIPGIIKQNDLQGDGWVSSDGTTVVFPHHTHALLIDIAKGSVREMPMEYERLSSDVKFEYRSAGMDQIWKSGERQWVAKLFVKPLDGSARDTLVSDWFSFGLDANGRVIASKAVMKDNGNFLSCLVGLYALERKTWQPVATLRTDTIYRPGVYSFGSSWNAGAPDGWTLQPSMLMLAYGDSWLRALPFGSTEVGTIHLPNVGYPYFGMDMIDDAYAYGFYDHYNFAREFVAYDLRSGQLVAQEKTPNAKEGQIMYATGGNRVYRYDRETSRVYVEVVGDGGFKILDSVSITGLDLSPGQKWSMQVCKGPSLLFTPLRLDPAEAGGTAANTASLVQLPSGKVSLRISPFFNRNATEVAEQAAAQKAFNELSARHQAEAEVEKAKADAERCKNSWNTAQYRKGLTTLYRGSYVILESYNCGKDEYRYYEPRQPEDRSPDNPNPGWKTAAGDAFREGSAKGDKQYHTCANCDGQGKYVETTSTTRTKELPWGYFSGIETTSTRTTTTKKLQLCLKCGGRGVVLE